MVLEHSLAPTFTVGIYLGPCSAGAGTEVMGVKGQRWGASVQLCKPTEWPQVTRALGALRTPYPPP